MQSPSAVLSHLARRKENCWRSRHHRLMAQRNGPYNGVRSLSTSDALLDKYHATGGGDKRGSSTRNQQYHGFWDLHDFKNGKNISVADYLNIESKYSSVLGVDKSNTVKTSAKKFDTSLFGATDDKFHLINPKPFSIESLIHPFKERTTVGIDPINSAPSSDDFCLQQPSARSRLTFLDTSQIDLRKLIDMTEGDLFVLELFEKSVQERDKDSRLPMLVLSHPKLFNGLVMNPMDVQELVSNPRIWAPILIPDSVANILSSNEKDYGVIALLSETNLADRNSDLILPSAAVPAEVLAPRTADEQSTTDSTSFPTTSATYPSVPSPPNAPPSSSLTAENPPNSASQRPRIGVIRRLSPKDMLRLIKSSNPHLQRTVDAQKYDFEEVLNGGRREIRYPALETKVAALLSSSFCLAPSGKMGVESVREGSDCVGIFDETNFFSDQYHCQSSDTGVATWGAEGELRILDVESIDGFVLHFGFLHRGALSVGDHIKLEINSSNRTATTSNHTSAHLINFGIDQLLPEEKSGGVEKPRIFRVNPNSVSVDSHVGEKEAKKLE